MYLNPKVFKPISILHISSSNHYKSFARHVLALQLLWNMEYVRTNKNKSNEDFKLQTRYLP